MRFFLWLLALPLLAQADEPTSELPFSGRKIPLAVAQELYKATPEAGLKILSRNGVRSCLWDNRQRQVHAVEDNISVPELRELALLADSGPKKFLASAAFEGVKKDEVVMKKTTFIFSMTEPLAKTTMAHEWLHWEIVKQPLPEFAGFKLPKAVDIQNRFFRDNKTYWDSYATPAEAPQSEADVKSHLEEYRLRAQIGNGLCVAQIVTLIDELDVHLLMHQKRWLDDARPALDELYASAFHVSVRAKNGRDEIAFARTLLKYRKLLDADLIATLEQTIKTEEVLKQIGRDLPGKVRIVATAAEAADWETNSKTVRSMKRELGIE